MNNLLDIYTDYLISSFSETTATGLSRLLDGEVSHDKVTRFLSTYNFSSSYLWSLVKRTVREIEMDDGVLIFDDTIEEKLYTDENEIVNWHFDPSYGRTIKGINILNALYHVKDVSVPVAFEIIHKPILYCDIKTRKIKRESNVTKNDLLRHILTTCQNNQLNYKYVLTDIGYASNENMQHIKLKIKKDFVMAMKSNRLVALTLEDKKQGNFVRIDSLSLEDGTTQLVYLKGLDFTVQLTKQVFKNKDDSEGILYLVSSDINLTSEQIITIYQKRWNVEVFHKSIKSNTSLSKSPTRTLKTQSNHIFASIYAAFKLEILKLKHHTNHFALKSKLYLKALQASFSELEKLSA
ncbi:MAG: IS701 family transposase [Candidatus Parabeggiatoa sp. nov. 3]|nr:MAG: IS701 family transposase [Gammaproteobacteria bacterium]RKZ66269.1 MAG: IS701 family transposase [Gammaproteobacteria bacterium]RKZ81496.1 MAG: IS701 family transposase [Gammaproteobacteria bacterium]